jgi:cobalt/nickel transport system ATP-binding protein
MPNSGSIEINGIPLDKAHVQEIRNCVGMVFQNPDDQLFMPTVYDDVAFGLRNRGLAESLVAEQVNGLLEQMGLMHLKDRPPYRLSGGEKRSAAIATALVMRPGTLLMDEPTAFLDPRARRNFLNQLKGMQIGMLIATHDLDLAKEYMDGVLIMKEGRIHIQGGTALLNDAQLMEDALMV